MDWSGVECKTARGREGRGEEEAEAKPRLITSEVRGLGFVTGTGRLGRELGRRRTGSGRREEKIKGKQRKPFGSEIAGRKRKGKWRGGMSGCRSKDNGCEGMAASKKTRRIFTEIYLLANTDSMKTFGNIGCPRVKICPKL